LGRVFACWQKAILDEYGKFMEIPNPYIVGPPVKSAELFRGRDDIFKFIMSNLSGTYQDRTLVLHGQRRTGKTSILYQLSDGRLGNDFIPVFIDMQELSLVKSTVDFLEQVAYKITQAVEKCNIQIDSPKLTDMSTSAFNRFLDVLENGLGNKRVVLMFDEYEVIEKKINDKVLDADILQYLRSLIQHRTKLVFIFTGAHELIELTQDYWSVFFNIALYKRISFLTSDEAARLIKEPVANVLDIADEAVHQIIELTHAHPFFTQLVCWALVNHCNIFKRSNATIEDVNAVVEEIMPMGEPHFAFIWRQTPGLERLAMACLAQSVAKDFQINKGWATTDEIVSILPAGTISKFKRKELVHALDQLVMRDVLENSKDPLRYRFQIELLRLWVKQTQSINDVIEREF
jgi:hypothetical protein